MVTKSTDNTTDKDIINVPTVPGGPEHEHEESDDNEEGVQETGGSFSSWISYFIYSSNQLMTCYCLDPPAAATGEQKKKKKKKKSKKKAKTGENKQTDPPRVGLTKIFVNGTYPEGEIQEYRE